MTSPPELWRGTVERLGWGGHGLARAADGRMILLRAQLALIPGEEVEAEVVWKARHGEGEVTRWVTPDPRRVPVALTGPRPGGLQSTVRTIQYAAERKTKSEGQGARSTTAECPVALRCGGCSLWGVDAGMRGELKRQMAADLLHRMLPGAPAWDWLPAPPDAKRSRIQLHWDGRQLGYFARGTHDLVPVSGCPMAADALSAGVALLALALERRALPTAPARWELSTGTPAGDIAASAFDTTWRFYGPPAAAPTRRRPPAGPGRPAYGGPAPPLREDSAPLTHALGDVLLSQHPRAFFQVSPEWAWQAFGQVLGGWEVGGTALFDLYSGGGFFSRLLARQFQRFVLVESSPLAVEDARANLAGLASAVHLSDVAAGLAGQPAGWATAADTVLLDPPRAGLPPEVSAALRACDAGQIVLVGCDGAAFCRDVLRLGEGGKWQLHQLAVIDLFPNTPEVECVGLFSR